MCVFFVDARGAHKLVSAQKHTHHTSHAHYTHHTYYRNKSPNHYPTTLYNNSGREGNIVKSRRC